MHNTGLGGEVVVAPLPHVVQQAGRAVSRGRHHAAPRAASDHLHSDMESRHGDDASTVRRARHAVTYLRAFPNLPALRSSRELMIWSRVRRARG